MNEQIRELWHKAAIDTHQNESTSWENEVKFIEKFAKLIVLECVGIADEYDGVGSTIVGRIKQHFGVEE